MRAACPLLALLLLGCGDVKGNLRLLLVPPHAGRNTVEDPFALVQTMQVGLADDAGRLTKLGSAAPLSRFGPGLVGTGRSGAPYVMGLNDRSRPVALGFGPPVTLESGLNQNLSIPFYPADHAQATRIPPSERTLPNPFSSRPPTLQLDKTHLETGAIDSTDNICALATLLWVGAELLVQVQVNDDAVVPAAEGQPLTAGDAVRIYLDGLGDGVAGGADDRVVTVSADGRADPADDSLQVQVERSGHGYRVTLVLPLPAAEKNHEVGFDLRVYDRDDASGSVALLTWNFDPRHAGLEPAPGEYGRVNLGVPLLDLISGPGAALTFPTPAGMVSVSGEWDSQTVSLQAEVPDEDVRIVPVSGVDLSGNDRVEFWIDLANDLAPIPQAVRFFRVTVTAGGSESHAGGSDPASLAPEGLAFTGQVQGTKVGSGYRVNLALPWTDLDLAGGDPQRGWFLGLEVRVLDVGNDGTVTTAWSGSDGIDPQLWPELRLYSLE